MATYVGYCHACKALSEFSDRRTCQRSRRQHDGWSWQTTCGARVSLLWQNHPVAQAILAAHRIGGWSAAVAVWDEAGRPEVAYDAR